MESQKGKMIRKCKIKGKLILKNALLTEASETIQILCVLKNNILIIHTHSKQFYEPDRFIKNICLKILMYV